MPKAKKQKRKKVKNKSKRKVLRAEVVSNRMDKTVVVECVNKRAHPLYHKIVRSSKKHKAHTERDLSIGDIVEIEQCKPISKDKTWRVINVLKEKSKKS